MPLRSMPQSLTEQWQDGSRALKEAISLAPDNANVKAAFEKILSDDLQHLFHKLCRKFAQDGDEDAGKEAISYLGRSAEVPADVAKDCMELMLTHQYTPDQQTRDSIVAGLVRESPPAKAFIAKRLLNNITHVTFEEMYRLGDGGASSVVAVVLDPSVWPSETSRETCEKDVFQLALAKLISVDDDYVGKAMKSIVRMLAADAERLHTLIDDDTFDVILSTLDDRNSTDIRSQATLATAKYLEVAEEKGQKALTQFVASRVARQKNEDLVLAFSAAAGVFPIAPSMLSTLFLSQGFVPSLVPLLEKKARSEKVEQAALDMLSAACIDGACRDAVSKHCRDWLQHILKTGKGQRPNLAAVILAKLQGPPGGKGNEKAGNTGQHDNADDLIPQLQRMMVNGPSADKETSMEGLAYTSVQPRVKEQLVRDKNFLSNFLKTLKGSTPGSPAAFGGLTLIDNLTRYLPSLSDEQKRMSQLKAYANASKNMPQADPLDEEAAVTERCKTVMSAGAMPVLVAISRNLSQGSITIMFNILLSLSRTSTLRGTIAQQGGIKVLLQNYTRITGSSTADIQSRHTAAHALARILISVDPSHVFPSSGSISSTSAVQPLLTLLTEDPELVTQGPRNLLPTFEALLALTNLASVPESGARELIIRLAVPTIEELLLNNNTLVQRATTELVCNLVDCPKGIELFADESKAAARRLHILLAMADVDDKATRQAAGGALAVLTEFEGAVKEVLAIKRGMEILLGLCEDEDEGIVHRGVVCMMNAVCLEGKIGKEAQGKAKELEVDEVLRGIIQISKNRAVIEGSVQALKVLSDYSATSAV